MSIKIHMLNVGDADAIVVQLTKGSLETTLLVDGGKTEDHADQIITYLEGLHVQPQTIICTHLDRDHIGGFPKILRKYRNEIKSIWTHIPEEHYHKGSFEKALFENVKQDRRLELIVASVQDLKNLLDVASSLGLRDKIVEPFSDSRDLLTMCACWGISILGPSTAFYESLVPEILKGFDTRTLELGEAINPCAMIGQDGFDRPVNESSLIFQIYNNGQQFLFPGDAGLMAFGKIKDSLTKIYWLKVPHHGSKSNLNAEIIGKLRPDRCFISATDTNGHPDRNIIACLRAHGATKIECTGALKRNLIEEN